MAEKTDELRREVHEALVELREVESHLASGATSLAHERLKQTLARLQQLIHNEKR